MENSVLVLTCDQGHGVPEHHQRPESRCGTHKCDSLARARPLRSSKRMNTSWHASEFSYDAIHEICHFTVSPRCTAPPCAISLSHFIGFHTSADA